MIHIITPEHSSEDSVVVLVVMGAGASVVVLVVTGTGASVVVLVVTGAGASVVVLVVTGASVVSVPTVQAVGAAAMKYTLLIL